MPTRPPVHRPAGWRPPSQTRAEADKRRPAPAERGYDAAWRALRAKVLRDRPYCEKVGCGSSFRVNVHHRQSVREAPGRRLDESNLEVLCHNCHSRHTAKETGLGRRS